MPKPFLPPQGGEKWLCLGMFLMLLSSIIMVVACIYCIVIIYIPSIEEQKSTILPEPKRCVTTEVKRNITSIPGDGKCAWSSCMEWCLTKGAPSCSKVYGLMRERGADMEWQECDLEPESPDDPPEGPTGFLDHTCSTLDDLEELNCKRSKWELERAGQVEQCRLFNSLISCRAGECKNVSLIYECTFANTLLEIMDPWGKEPYMTDGFCNCNQCEESNTSLVEDVTVSKVKCPKETRYCFEAGRDPSNYTEERRQLCQAPTCQTCFDMCKDQLNCLSIHSRQDVAYFGVDMTKDPPEPKLTYYHCVEGECIKVHKLQCRRTCDFKKFNFKKKNLALFSGERVLLGHCRKAYINDSTVGLLPTESPVNPDWAWMAATCSKIEVNREFNTIYGSDCTNGTWLNDMGITNYSTLTIEYAKQRENRERFIKFDPNDDESLIPSEPDITILNRTKIKKNTEGCVNTLSLECMHFFAEYGKDGANYTSMVSYDCYYDPYNLEYVVVDFTPERTLKFLIFWAILPSVVIVISCVYICICSKLMYTGEDGHMRIYIMGRAVTGIGEVVVYKPPPRKERKKKEETNGKKPVNV